MDACVIHGSFIFLSFFLSIEFAVFTSFNGIVRAAECDEAKKKHFIFVQKFPFRTCLSASHTPWGSLLCIVYENRNKNTLKEFMNSRLKL